MRFDDDITDLCADIDAWSERTLGEDTPLQCRDAADLLRRARHMLKEMLAEWPR